MSSKLFTTLSLFSLFVFFGSQAHAESLTATIDSPSNGDRVSGRINVSGTISEPLEPGSQLWIVVRKGELMWPKDPPVLAIGNTWSKTVHEGGRGEFSLVLFLVKKEGQDQIKSWIDYGIKYRDFSGLTEIKGTALAEVTVLQP